MPFQNDWILTCLLSFVCFSSTIKSTPSHLRRSEIPPVMLCRKPKRWDNSRSIGQHCCPDIRVRHDLQNLASALTSPFLLFTDTNILLVWGRALHLIGPFDKKPFTLKARNPQLHVHTEHSCDLKFSMLIETPARGNVFTRCDFPLEFHVALWLATCLRVTLRGNAVMTCLSLWLL